MSCVPVGIPFLVLVFLLTFVSSIKRKARSGIERRARGDSSERRVQGIRKRASARRVENAHVVPPAGFSRAHITLTSVHPPAHRQDQGTEHYKAKGTARSKVEQVEAKATVELHQSARERGEKEQRIPPEHIRATAVRNSIHLLGCTSGEQVRRHKNTPASHKNKRVKFHTF